jgi:hypothetical protein
MIAFEEQDLLYCTNYKLTEQITIHIPTIKEILSYGEENFFNLISLSLATSKDYMVELYDNGIDYETVSDFELFSQMLFFNLKQIDTSIIFNNLNLDDFKLVLNPDNNETVLFNEKENIIIDQHIYNLICDKLREILFLEKDNYKAGNYEAKMFMIERARKKKQRASKKPCKPVLRPLIISLVNCPEFKYNYEQTYDMSIFRIYASIKAIQKRINYNNIMRGIYAGTINSSDINMQEINWIY